MLEVESDALVAHRPGARGVKVVGTCFSLLGGLAGLGGALWVVDSFRRVAGAGAVQDETFQTLKALGIPVLVSVLGVWLLIAIGRGLNRGSPLARWGALALLVTACVPPLVLFFSAVRGGEGTDAACALAFLLPPAGGSLLLSRSSTDLLFRAKGGAILDATPAGLVARLLFMVLGLVAIIVLMALAR
jgi:hypothetical protein